MAMKLHWWQRGVVYQIYPRSFFDANGDGIGDLQGIIDKLDYLNDGTPDSLGIDAIWISPFYPSPMIDFGYDVSDYCNVHPMFGDLATFDRLITAAHQREIKVIVDWVPNHTSDQHPWFIESRSSRDNPKRDWYIWRDGKPDGSLPNNWGSFFGGPAWTFDAHTGQYYLHQFCPEQPEFNWRNPEAKAAMLEVLKFWLDRGVDGFRMDVIALIIKDAGLRDNPINPNAPADLRENDIFGRLHQTYNMDQDDVHPVLGEIRAILDAYSDRCAIGELWAELPRYVKYYDELHLPFNFGLLWFPWNAFAIRAHVDSLEGALPATAWPNYVLGNHDQPRLASRIGGQAQARVGAMLLLTLRGTPTIYNGEELGLENGHIPPEKIQDPQGVNLGPERTRDICRTPMQWNASLHAGFSPADPWLPVCDDYPIRNVAVQSTDPTSMLSLYRRLIWLRRTTPALYGGSYRGLDTDERCFTYLRVADDQAYLIALNFSADALELTITEAIGQILISTHLDREGESITRTFSLRGHEGIIVKLEKIPM